MTPLKKEKRKDAADQRSDVQRRKDKTNMYVYFRQSNLLCVFASLRLCVEIRFLQ